MIWASFLIHRNMIELCTQRNREHVPPDDIGLIFTEKDGDDLDRRLFFFRYSVHMKCSYERFMKNAGFTDFHTQPPTEQHFVCVLRKQFQFFLSHMIFFFS